MHGILSHPSSKALTHPSFSECQIKPWYQSTRIICDLCVLSPDNLSSRSNETQWTHIDFNNCLQLMFVLAAEQNTPRVRTPSCVYIGLLGFFLTPIIGHWTVTANSRWVTFAFFILKPMGRINRSIYNEHFAPELKTKKNKKKETTKRTVYLDRSSSEPLPHKSRLRNNPLPTLPLTLPSLQNLKYLLLRHPPNFWQRHAKPCSSLFPLLLDHTRQLLCRFLLRSVQKIRWHCPVWYCGGFGSFDVALFMLFYLFFHLDFGEGSLSVMEFGF